jgi:hypothetical protein
MSVPIPEVTVLMPVHNAASFVEEALRSVFAQTHADLEVLLVDDASTDGTGEVIRRFDDPRLRTLRHAQREGVAVALNTGLKAARGRLIARMDADDIALPERLSRQVTFLARHPSVGILGGNLQPVGWDGRPSAPATSVPVLPGHVGWMLHVHNCVNHPTVIARREVLLALGGYRPEMVPAEDYDLWVRALAITRIANISDLVLHYRVHPASTSVAHDRAVSATAIGVAEQALTGTLGSSPDRRALELLRDPAGAGLASPEVVRGAVALLWGFTTAVLEAPGLMEPEKAAIRRTSAEWYLQLVRATAQRRLASAVKLFTPGGSGPPTWVYKEVAAAAARRRLRARTSG